MRDKRGQKSHLLSLRGLPPELLLGWPPPTDHRGLTVELGSCRHPITFVLL